jgi:hypothetical protein
VLFRRLVVFVLHGCFLIIGRRMSASDNMVTHRGIHNCAMQWKKQTAMLPLFYRTSATRSSRPHTEDVKFARDKQRVVRQEHGSASPRWTTFPLQNPKGTFQWISKIRTKAASRAVKVVSKAAASRTRTSNPASRRRSPDRADSKAVRADKVASTVVAASNRTGNQ